ncbi:c-type cytochrome [Ferruginibacter profundus]
MRNRFFILSAIAATVVMAVAACNNKAAETAGKPTTMDSTEMVERGKYLVNAIGCDDCHSPKRMGPNGPEIIPELRLSGFPHDGKLPPIDTNVVKKGWAVLAPDLTSAVGMWGQSYAANITGDATGIGAWKEEQFIKALREGKLKGLDNTRPLLPPMPWFAYKNMKDEDLKSIFAYLKTVKPVENIVPLPKKLSDLQ